MNCHMKFVPEIMAMNVRTSSCGFPQVASWRRPFLQGVFTEIHTFNKSEITISTFCCWCADRCAAAAQGRFIAITSTTNSSIIIPIVTKNMSWRKEAFCANDMIGGMAGFLGSFDLVDSVGSIGISGSAR